jgi:DNA end-binding protein Ku
VSPPRRHGRKASSPKAAEPKDEATARPARGRPKGQVWKGTISFGLVSIPVVLQSGENRKELGFSLLDRRDMSPVGYRKINKSTGEEVPSREVVKGWKTEEGEFVLVGEEDLKRAAPERTNRIDILAFVDADAVPATFFDRPYYLEPAAKSEKAYALLREAMRRAGKTGIATVVLRARQYLCAVIPMGPALVLELLRYADELRDPGDLHLPGEDLKRLKVTEGELNMAGKLIEELAKPWRPEEYRDEYRAELLSFLEKKARAGETEEAAAPAPEAEAKAKAPPADIMSLLKRSLAASKGGAR